MARTWPEARRLMLAMTMAPAVSFAQEVTEVEHRERVEVTGSNIKRTEAEGPAPLLVLRREDLALRAGQNVQEFLIGLPYANIGSFAESRNGAAAGVSLRGLGADSTLVLVNGRRVAVNGFAGSNGAMSVNLNAIPTAAIERIEVLKDGASAIYGSDAIAGVVNIILRKDFRGMELVGSHGESGKGDTGETRASLTAGAGQLARDRFNAMMTLEYYHRDRLEASQRERSSDADQRTNGGHDWRQTQGRPGSWLTDGKPGFATNTPMPGCPAELLENQLDVRGLCAFNENAYLVAYPRTQRKSVFGRVDAALTPEITAFAEASWIQAATETGGVPVADSFQLPVGNSSNPYPFDVDIVYRWLELGRRFQMADNRTTRFVAGVETSVRGIDFDAAYNRVASRAVITNMNNISVASRTALRLGNVYDFVDPSRNDPAIADSVRTNTWRSRDSDLESIDARASGTAYELATGPIRVAGGAEWRRESLSGARDANYGTFVNLSNDSHEAGSRTVKAIFAEANVPLHSTVEAQLAVRTERYSDFGDSTAPKAALSWKPSTSLLLRAGYSRGFRAPSLVQLYLDQRTTNIPLLDAPRCAAYNSAFGLTDPRSLDACALRNIRVFQGGNPSLDAEDSAGTSLGFVIEPAHGFSVSVDAFDIRQRGRVLTQSPSMIVANEDAFAGAVLRDPVGPNDLLAGSRGPIVGSLDPQRRIGIRGTFMNAGLQQVRGADVELHWRLGLGPGTLRVQSLNTYLQSLRQANAAGLPEEDITRQRAGTPRYRGWHSASWVQGPWTASAIVNAVGRSMQPDDSGKTVASWITVDLQAVYAGFRGLVLTAGVRNVADRAPPFFDDVLGFDETTHSIVGRFFYLRAVYRFK